MPGGVAGGWNSTAWRIQQAQRARPGSLQRVQSSLVAAAKGLNQQTTNYGQVCALPSLNSA